MGWRIDSPHLSQYHVMVASCHDRKHPVFAAGGNARDRCKAGLTSSKLPAPVTCTSNWKGGAAESSGRAVGWRLGNRCGASKSCVSFAFIPGLRAEHRGTHGTLASTRESSTDRHPASRQLGDSTLVHHPHVVPAVAGSCELRLTCGAFRAGYACGGSPER